MTPCKCYAWCDSFWKSVCKEKDVRVREKFNIGRDVSLMLLLRRLRHLGVGDCLELSASLGVESSTCHRLLR